MIRRSSTLIHLVFFIVNGPHDDAGLAKKEKKGFGDKGYDIKPTVFSNVQDDIL